MGVVHSDVFARVLSHVALDYAYLFFALSMLAAATWTAPKDVTSKRNQREATANEQHLPTPSGTTQSGADPLTRDKRTEPYEHVDDSPGHRCQ